MNITLEQNGVSALVTVKLEQGDYQDAVKKELKNISAKAEMPGFRPGKVPAGLINKRFGAQVKADTINRVLGEGLMNYINENKVNILGEPMMSEKQQPQDIENQNEFEFLFDIALAPEFSYELSNADKLPYYDIEVSDEQIDAQVKNFAQQAGHPESVEEYADRDILRGALAQQDEKGNVLEGGLALDKASLMPAYFVNDDQKKIFEGAKVGDVITFNPSVAHSQNELAALLKVSKEEAANQYNEDADYKFLLDVRKYADEKVGKLEFPEELLKRFMKEQNAEKGEEFVENNFAQSLEELKWHLIKEKLVAKAEIKIDDADVRAAAVKTARFQFAQYGMNNVPEEYLENYAAELLKDRNQVNGFVERSINEKLAKALKEVVTLEHKAVSVEDFQKLFQDETAE